MNETPGIQLENVGKRYVKLSDRRMLVRSILPFARPSRTDLWALQDVNLSVGRGETVGVLGRNGAGKTTMLRLLAGVSQPTTGRITTAGRVAPLISVGVGFQGEMSGRENIYINGMLLGLDRHEIDDRFGAIVEFAELDDFIDTPIKFYSTGMFMRLGFSVVVHVEPDILLVDEVLAVGDLAFQFKCLDRMRLLQDSGTTIVMVSHSVSAIRLLCPRAIVMRQGHVEFDGDSGGAVAKHYELLSLQAEERSGIETDDIGGVKLIRRVLECNGAQATTLPQHAPVKLRQRFRFDQDVDSPEFLFTVIAENGMAAYQLLPTVGTRYRQYAAGEEAEVEIDFICRLAGGTYQLQTTVTSNDGIKVLYQDVDGLTVFVEPRLGSIGIAELDADTRVDGTSISDHTPARLRGPSH